MTGSPKQPTQPRRSLKRRRIRPQAPWALLSILFGLYGVIGLLLSAPAPPYWLWLSVALGTGLMTFGLNQPLYSSIPGKAKGIGLLPYIGGCLLAVSLAIATNYIGRGDSFNDIRFFVALLGLAVLILLAVAITGAVAILSAQAGARLSETMTLQSNMTALMSICFGGLLLGGLLGLLIRIL